MNIFEYKCRFLHLLASQMMLCRERRAPSEGVIAPEVVQIWQIEVNTARSFTNHKQRLPVICDQCRCSLQVEEKKKKGIKKQTNTDNYRRSTQ